MGGTDLLGLMDIYPGEFEALMLVVLAIAGLTLGGLIALISVIFSIAVRRDLSRGAFKGWAIAAIVVIIINAFAWGALTDLGRQNFQREGENQPQIQPPQPLIGIIALINLFAPSIGAIRPMIARRSTPNPDNRNTPDPPLN